jgi:hypothetical protein
VANDKDLYSSLRARGVRTKVAKPIGKLDGNRKRAGANGERVAKQAAQDLEDAASEIKRRVLRKNR